MHRLARIRSDSRNGTLLDRLCSCAALALAFVFLLPAAARAQTQPRATPEPALSPSPSPTPVRTVRLHFAPPPIEGTLSLGIYDGAGKLVRVLHREDSVDDFTAGHDALETTWNGNDDAGNPIPPGRYHARGYRVGDAVKVEGVDSFFNDWVTAEGSPHIAHISRIGMSGNLLALNATIADGKPAFFLFDPLREKLTAADASPTPAPQSNDGSLLLNPIAVAPGKEGTLWAINHLESLAPGVEVVQISREPVVLRRLAIAPGDPQPIGIAASPDEDRIYLLEQSPTVERVRSLTLQSTTAPAGQAQSVSDWRVDFSKEIVAHKNFSLAEGKPAISLNEQPPAPVQLVQKLRTNPLERDQPGKVTLIAAFDADGSYLATADGLPLRTISETENLSRTLIAREAPDAVDVFQDDGAVVEQFRVTHLGEMIAFDCGEFELK